MKLVHSLVLALTLGTIIVLGVMAALMRQREASLMEQNDREDLASMARAIRPSLVHTWGTAGKDAALSLLRSTEQTVQDSHGLTVDWIPLDGSPGLSPLRRGEDVFLVDNAGEGRLVLYVPVTDPALPPGALVLTKPLTQEREFLAAGVRSIVLTTAVLAATLTVFSLAFGAWRFGRPLRKLTEQARRIGNGDFGARVALQRRDELGVISVEMNRMAESLAAARARIEAEHNGRIATLEQLRHTDRLATVGELAAGVAHELGTPLSVVIGRARLIASGEHDGRIAANSAEVIAEQGERMTRIIRQLLNFARRRPGPKARVDVRAVARQTITLLESLARKRGVALELLEPESPEEAVIESNQVEQALTNLVVNGIQALRHGGTVKIAIAEAWERPPTHLDAAAGTFLKIEVTDDGEGIDAEDLPHVFDPFFTTRPIGEGTGLGLSVAYGIARDHGGWIDATSRRGGGSSFVIHLPLAHQGNGSPLEASHGTRSSAEGLAGGR